MSRFPLPEAASGARSRRLALLTGSLLVLALGALSGCATLNQVQVEVSSHGDWPAGRTPGSYAIERLPSQQTDLAAQQALEDAARPALSLAGFKEVPAEQAELLVQLASRSQKVVTPDPFYPGWGGPFYGGYGYPWWRGPGVYVGGAYGSRYYRGSSIGLGFGPELTQTQRETAVLIRDRSSQKVIFETRARLLGGSSDRVVPLMFEAALKDFPQAAPGPRTLTLQLPPN
ncbi:DUF4136 domain-containing protein [Aquariibacter albus]|uniref:DUF4136 domain-containing protein n=1 Tax=Aquariibacter albus TaxID=2759899 RepID=A0A839HRK8_9BURK|nr:DUF4136 domain-containing protein [Aquariibacter albus]MBB1162238.1 DUF4136 domain-containing protein [Aquariibacter albus]